MRFTPSSDTVTSLAFRRLSAKKLGPILGKLALYESLTAEEREKVPQVLRFWLRYRSEKYFGEGRTPGRGKK